VKELDLQEFNDLFEVREALEVHAVGLAIDNQTTEDLEPCQKNPSASRIHAPLYDRKSLF